MACGRWTAERPGRQRSPSSSTQVGAWPWGLAITARAPANLLAGVLPAELLLTGVLGVISVLDVSLVVERVLLMVWWSVRGLVMVVFVMAGLAVTIAGTQRVGSERVGRGLTAAGQNRP